MIALWLVAAAALCLVGTRLAAAVFVAAAVASAFEPGTAGTVSTWTAATGAGLLGVGMPVRRLALPAVGAAAVVLAAFGPNAAAVLLAWTIGSAAAVAGRPPGDEGRRWAAGVLLADLPFAAAVVWTVLAQGFVPWPAQLSPHAAYLVLASAALRAPLAAGVTDRAPEGGLMLVRIQVLALVALAASAGPSPARSVVALGAVGFAGGWLVGRPGVRDVLQEVSLWGVLVASAALGWVPHAWAWAAVAAGTLVHLGRIAQARRGAERGLWDVVAGGAVGSPLLAAAALAAVGAVWSGDVFGGVVLVGLAAGLAGRLVAPAPGGRGLRVRTVVRGALLLVTLALGVWAPFATRAYTSTAASGFWPSAWGVAVLAIGAVAGGRFASASAPGRPRRPRGPAVPAVGTGPSHRLLELARVRGALAAPLSALGATALFVWIWGWTRGFL